MKKSNGMLYWYGLAATMAIESNSNLQVPNSPLNRNGSLDVGPMQLNRRSAGKDYRIFGSALGTNFTPRGSFNGDVRANIATGAAYLRDSERPEFYYSSTPGLARQRRELLNSLLPSLTKFFDCLAARARP